MYHQSKYFGISTNVSKKNMYIAAIKVFFMLVACSDLIKFSQESYSKVCLQKQIEIQVVDFNVNIYSPTHKTMVLCLLKSRLPL